MNAPMDWLLEGEPYIAYRTRRELLGQAEDEPQVQAARQTMLTSPAVQALVAELSGWPGKVIASHKSAGQPFHKLTFLADLGLRAGDPGMDAVITRILATHSAEGPFTLPSTIPTHYGGTGEEVWGWALCDAPLTVYALVKFGLQDEPAVRAAVNFITGLVRANGWPCAVAAGLKFRGPGRAEDPCPFANLAVLKLLAAQGDRGSQPAQAGAETLLALWQQSATRHPYIFYMGTDFRKPKVPLVWYDLVHVLDVLSRFEWVRSDPRYQDMLGLLGSRMDTQGRFTLESVWTAWKDWEFGQKKTPSRWLTLVAWEILTRN